MMEQAFLKKQLSLLFLLLFFDISSIAHADEVPIRTSLASPMRDKQTQVVAPPPLWTEQALTTFQPELAIEWLNIESNSSQGDQVSASWFGVRGGVQYDLSQTLHFSSGIRAEAFRTVSSLSPDADNASTTEFSLLGTTDYFPSFLRLGKLRLSLSGGYFAHLRKSSDPTVSFLPPAKGARVELNASTSYDQTLRFGLGGGYTFVSSGLIHAHAFFRHRFFHSGAIPWDLKIKAQISALQEKEANSPLEESWKSVQVGITGAL